MTAKALKVPQLCVVQPAHLQVLELLVAGVDVVHQHLTQHDDLLPRPLHEAVERLVHKTPRAVAHPVISVLMQVGLAERYKHQACSTSYKV